MLSAERRRSRSWLCGLHGEDERDVAQDAILRHLHQHDYTAVQRHSLDIRRRFGPLRSRSWSPEILTSIAI